MTQPYVAATREALGFSPRCDCGDWAVCFLQVHPVDLCRWFSEPMEGRLVCGFCLRKQLRLTQDLLLEVFLGLRSNECEGCGLQIETLGDIIVRLCPLWIWED